MPSGYRFTTRFWIYVLGHEDGPQKVGFSNDPDTRARTLKVAGRPHFIVHYRHEVPPHDVRFIEQLAHHLLEDKALGREWFDVTPDEAARAVASAVERYAAGERAPGRDPSTLCNIPVRVLVSAEEAERITEFRARTPGIPTRSEAIRMLVLEALDAREKSPHPRPNRNSSKTS